MLVRVTLLHGLVTSFIYIINIAFSLSSTFFLSNPPLRPYRYAIQKCKESGDPRRRRRGLDEDAAAGEEAQDKHGSRPGKPRLPQKSLVQEALCCVHALRQDEVAHIENSRDEEGDDDTNHCVHDPQERTSGTVARAALAALVWGSQ